MSAISRLQSTLNEAWPNDKDLIADRDFLKVQRFHEYYLLADAQGYLGYVTNIEDLMELINEQSSNPGVLRRATNAPVHKFRSRGFKREKIDINSIIKDIDL